MTDRIIRIVLGIVLIVVFLMKVVPSPWSYPVALIGLIALVTGAVGTCPFYSIFGMSKVLALDTKKSSIVGFSLTYAAPEQVSPLEFGRTDARTDIYQLGVVFYELVTGSIPFGGESMMEVGNAILREPPIPPSGYNADAAAVDRIILKCLEKDPGHRYQSADELLAALSGHLDEDAS